LSPFALVKEIRREFDGVLILSGAMSSGGDILAAQAMGADLAYIGTRFIATREANAPDEYKQMIVSSKASDIVYTPVTAATCEAASKTPAWIRTTCLTWTNLRWTLQVPPNRVRRRGAIYGERDRA
jgi:NAD(P)H-dependent flavin oxidoreductase YrpB (nitropropane dioxygenase family)